MTVTAHPDIEISTHFSMWQENLPGNCKATEVSATHHAGAFRACRHAGHTMTTRPSSGKFTLPANSE